MRTEAPAASILTNEQALRPSRLRRLGIFLLAVTVASVAGGLVEWSARWVLPSEAAVFLARTATAIPILYGMPVILAEDPPWTQRRRRRFAAVGALVLATLMGLMG